MRRIGGGVLCRAASAARCARRGPAGKRPMRTLREAALRPADVRVLDLSGTEDLQCTNIMCERVGRSCVCKLARWIEQTGPRLTQLEEIRLRGSGIHALPASLLSLTSLRVLDLSDNDLSDEGAGSEADLPGLCELRLHGNQLGRVPAWVLSASHTPALERVTLDHGCRDAEALRRVRPGVRVEERASR